MSKNLRDRLDIYADILRAVGDGSRKTKIVYGAYLNFERCKRFLEILREKGLVEIVNRSPLIWKVTDLGEKFLENYENIRDMLPRSEGETEKKAIGDLD